MSYLFSMYSNIRHMITITTSFHRNCKYRYLPEFSPIQTANLSRQIVNSPSATQLIPHRYSSSPQIISEEPVNPELVTRDTTQSREVQGGERGGVGEEPAQGKKGIWKAQYRHLIKGDIIVALVIHIINNADIYPSLG